MHPGRRETASFAREATYRGVDRVVIPGNDDMITMDGILPMIALLWVILK